VCLYLCVCVDGVFVQLPNELRCVQVVENEEKRKVSVGFTRGEKIVCADLVVCHPIHSIPIPSHLANKCQCLCSISIN